MGDVEGVNRAYAAWGVTCTFSHPCVNMKTRQVPLKEGVCIFAVAAVVHTFVFIVVSARKGVCRGGVQGEVCRLPFVSHGCGQSSSSR